MWLRSGLAMEIAMGLWCVSGGDYNPFSLIEGDGSMGFTTIGRLLPSL